MSSTHSNGHDGLVGPLTIPCPACKKPAGEKCYTVLDGVDVGWTHDARYEAHGGFRMAPWSNEDPDDAEHPATPTEETAEVADEDREVLATIAARTYFEGCGWTWEELHPDDQNANADKFDPVVRAVAAALTANAKAEVHDLRARLAKVEALAQNLAARAEEKHDLADETDYDLDKARLNGEGTGLGVAHMLVADLVHGPAALANPDAAKEGP